MKITGKIIVFASACLFAWNLTAWAAMPFSDDFESYTNQTPLINGLNGWYASDVTCIAQTNISYTNYGGNKSAQIPIDVTLSNRFTGNAFTSVWVRFYSRAVFFDGQTNVDTGIAQPVVGTNLSAMFFINTAGYFVVHNGPFDPDPTNSTKWVTLTNTPVTAGSWTRVDVLLDYPTTNWTIYVGGSIMTNNIGFIDTSIKIGRAHV